MTPSITVRSMQTSDLADVAGLCAQLGYPSTEAQVAERFVQLAASDRDEVLVAHDGQHVVGWIHLHIALTLETDRHVEIGGLVVDEGARGKGAGRLLVAEGERWAGAHRCSRMRVRSNVTRWGAHGFYQGLGYRIVKTQYTFVKECE